MGRALGSLRLAGVSWGGPPPPGVFVTISVANRCAAAERGFLWDCRVLVVRLRSEEALRPCDAREACLVHPHGRRAPAADSLLHRPRRSYEPGFLIPVGPRHIPMSLSS